MIASEFVAQVILRATGKVSTSTSGDAKWSKVLGIGNMKISDWQNEPGVDWSSLYDPTCSIGTISNTDTFDLDLDTIRKLSDTPQDVVRIMHTNGTTYTDYEIVQADTLKLYYKGQTKQSPVGYYCAQIGSTLVFNHKFVSTDPQYGGDIQVPVYLYAQPLVGDSDTVPVDNPGWLVVISAAEYVRTDIIRQAQYPNLINEANNLMQRMKDDNEAQGEYIHTPWRPAGATW